MHTGEYDVLVKIFIYAVEFVREAIFLEFVSLSTPSQADLVSYLRPPP